MFRCIYCRSVFERHSLYWELLQNMKVLRSMQQYCQRKTSSGLWDFTGEEYAGILFLIFKLRCPFFFYYYTVFLVRKLDVCLSRPSSETSSKRLKEHLVLFVWKDCSVSQKSNLKLILRKMLFVLIKEGTGMQIPYFTLFCGSPLVRTKGENLRGVFFSWIAVCAWASIIFLYEWYWQVQIYHCNHSGARGMPDLLNMQWNVL